MLTGKLSKMCVLLSVIVLVSTIALVNPASALVSQTSSWFTTSDTRVSSVATGDVNYDGLNEIVTGGYYNDGTHWLAQLMIISGSTMAVLNSGSWLTVGDTQIAAVAVGDVTGDGKAEIVTGGAYYDGTRWNAQITVWNGSTMAVIGFSSWYSIGNTEISSLAIGDVNGDAINEIVAGGAFFDGTHWTSQMTIWTNVPSLTCTGYIGWLTIGDTSISSIAIGDLNADTRNEIVTGGSFFNGVNWNSQLTVWNYTTNVLALLNYGGWMTFGNTQLTSLAIGDVNGDNTKEIVTGGYFNDTIRLNSQITVWTATTTLSVTNLAVVNYVWWFTTGNTTINSITLGNYSNTLGLDIFTGGQYFDATRGNAQLVDLNGVNLATRSVTNYAQILNTEITGTSFTSIGGANRVISGGSFYDGTRSNAQVGIWT